MALGDRDKRCLKNVYFLWHKYEGKKHLKFPVVLKDSVWKCQRNWKNRADSMVNDLLATFCKTCFWVSMICCIGSDLDKAGAGLDHNLDSPHSCFKLYVYMAPNHRCNVHHACTYCTLLAFLRGHNWVHFAHRL